MLNHTIDQQILELHQSGYSIREIAAELDITKYTVERALKSKPQTLSRTLSDTEDQTSNNSIYPVSGHNQTTTMASPDTDQTPESAISDHEEPLPASSNKNLYSTEQFFLMLTLGDFQRDYRNFISRMQDFLSNHVGSEELVPSFIRTRQRNIDDFIRTAKKRSQEFNISYNRLFMGYTLDTLYMYLEEKPELERTKHELKFKENSRINLLLRKAYNSEVFDFKEDYAIYFPDIIN